MGFQRDALGLASKLHLDAVPRPVMAGVLVALLAAVGLGAFLSFGAVGGFEVSVVEASPEVEAAHPDQEAQSGEPAVETVPPEDASVSPEKVVVHVAGAVASPGVYELAAGGRIAEAVELAGGMTEEAWPQAVNLAQRVEDGQQVVVPTREEAETAGSPASTIASSGPTGDVEPTGGKVSINRASAEELESLSGIGPATAEKIIADREANGPFASLDDLTRVTGIGEKKLAAIREDICL